MTETKTDLAIQPANEQKRVLALSELDLDYSSIQNSLKDLTQLASQITGMPVSLINLIDTYHQWSVGTHGFDILEMPREDSVCQYTILEENKDGFEVSDLSVDDRFKDRFYVEDDPNMRYYYGVPLKLKEDLAIGALCVLDTKSNVLSEEKKQMLGQLAKVITNRLTLFKTQKLLEDEISDTKRISRKLAHEIRGPIGGIIGLTEVIQIQPQDSILAEVSEYVDLIQKSGKTILELADHILSEDKTSILAKSNTSEIDLPSLAEKVRSLYLPTAMSKNIDFEVQLDNGNRDVKFSPKRILQILGNLISNAIKFTQIHGQVAVSLRLDLLESNKILTCVVSDNGEGMSQSKIDEILSGKVESSEGTSGEKGFGFGLGLVTHMIKEMKGNLKIKSEVGKGSTFTVEVYPN